MAPSAALGAASSDESPKPKALAGELAGCGVPEIPIILEPEEERLWVRVLPPSDVAVAGGVKRREDAGEKALGEAGEGDIRSDGLLLLLLLPLLVL